VLKVAVGSDEQETVWMGATSGSNQVEAIITRMVQATIKVTGRTNTGSCGSVELQAIAAVHESLIVKMVWGERRGHGTFGAVSTATDGVPHVAGLSF
jgi:hypothetical protein